MELTIGVAVGSSIQIAAGMIPLLVIIAWPLNKDLTLDFTTFETIVLFVSVMLVNLLLQDGTYGSMLIRSMLTVLSAISLCLHLLRLLDERVSETDRPVSGTLQ